MTPRQFIEQFNQAGFADRGKMIVEHLYPEPDQSLQIVLKKNPAADAIQFNAYTKKGVGISYFSQGAKVIPFGAFRLYERGQQCFNSWVKSCANPKFAEGLRQRFIEAFDGLALPNHMQN